MKISLKSPLARSIKTKAGRGIFAAAIRSTQNYRFPHGNLNISRQADDPPQGKVYFSMRISVTESIQKNIPATFAATRNRLHPSADSLTGAGNREDFPSLSRKRI
jgi:hypothetical protein